MNNNYYDEKDLRTRKCMRVRLAASFIAGLLFWGLATERIPNNWFFGVLWLVCWIMQIVAAVSGGLIRYSLRMYKFGKKMLIKSLRFLPYVVFGGVGLFPCIGVLGLIVVWFEFSILFPFWAAVAGLYYYNKERREELAPYPAAVNE